VSGPFDVDGLVDGHVDGARDTAAASSCPPGVPLGPDPAKSWSVRYMQGYDAAYNPMPCLCDGSCKRGKERGESPDNDASGGQGNASGGVDYWYSGDVINA
jgi:hypothetical protein